MAVRYALLDIVQKTLSAMDGDEVNSLGDTTESIQVTDCAEIVYNDIMVTADLPEQFRLYSLTSSINAATPIVMYRPEGMESLLWLKYNRTLDPNDDGRRYWTLLPFVHIDEFLKRQDGLNLDDPSTAQMSLVLPDTTLQILYRTDRAPDWYTTFDDNTVLFNSIDLSIEPILQSSQTLAYGETSTSFVRDDNFVPGFDSNAHQIWLHETIALAQARYRQLTDAKAEKSARKNWIKFQDTKKAIKTPYYKDYPNYGRK